MARIRRNESLIRRKHCINYSRICLCASDKKINIGFRALTGSADFSACCFAEGVRAIARQGCTVYLHQTPKNIRMCAFHVIRRKW